MKPQPNQSANESPKKLKAGKTREKAVKMNKNNIWANANNPYPFRIQQPSSFPNPEHLWKNPWGRPADMNFIGEYNAFRNGAAQGPNMARAFGASPLQLSRKPTPITQQSLAANPPANMQAGRGGECPNITPWTSGFSSPSSFYSPQVNRIANGGGNSRLNPTAAGFVPGMRRY